MAAGGIRSRRRHERVPHLPRRLDRQRSLDRAHDVPGQQLRMQSLPHDDRVVAEHVPPRGRRRLSGRSPRGARLHELSRGQYRCGDLACAGLQAGLRRMPCKPLQARPAQEVRRREIQRQRAAQLLGSVPRLHEFGADDHPDAALRARASHHRQQVRLMAIRAFRWPLALLLPFATAVVHAQTAGRLVEEVGVTEQRGYVAVTVLFGCSLRYVSHTPASSGDRVSVRLSPQPDCGAPAGGSIVPPTLDGRGVIRSIELNRALGTDLELRIGWSRPEQFVLVPSFDGRGLRIRLMRAEEDRSKVSVREVTGGASTYAVNLDAAKTPFEAEAVAAAADATGVRTYVSEIVIDEERWYRLRAGPFLSESDARRVIATARARYPKAWLAVGDDATLNAVGSPDAVANVPATRPGGNASLMPAEIERTLKQAREAFRRKDYATAIPLLTRLMEQPEFPQRAEALELLGLARERNGQLAHAEAECEEYLRRYPQGEAADR
ncbi:MAG: tetratricopeptide repeat protein, partial [Actinomycetota bacterium]